MQSTKPNEVLRVLSAFLGVVYTLSWSLSFYPQVFLNIRRRSTTGTTPSFPILNVLGFCCYSVSTAAFLFSPSIRKQYEDRHRGTENTVRWNDFAFAVHALMLSALTLSQYWSSLWGFEQRKWRVGTVIWGVVGGSISGVLWMIIMVGIRPDKGWQWLDVVCPTNDDDSVQDF